MKALLQPDGRWLAPWDQTAAWSRTDAVATVSPAARGRRVRLRRVGGEPSARRAGAERRVEAAGRRDHGRLRAHRTGPAPTGTAPVRGRLGRADAPSDRRLARGRHPGGRAGVVLERAVGPRPRPCPLCARDLPEPGGARVRPQQRHGSRGRRRRERGGAHPAVRLPRGRHHLLLRRSAAGSGGLHPARAVPGRAVARRVRRRDVRGRGRAAPVGGRRAATLA